MPMYEYRCEKCDKVFEYVVPLEKYEEKIVCPCCKEDMVKLMTATRVIKVN